MSCRKIHVWIRCAPTAAIFKENDLAKAYLRGGDPCYTQLCNLFGANNVKHELSHTVVLISDSPQVKKLELIEVGDSSSDEEVNSPIVGPNKNVVRKLTFVSGQVKPTDVGDNNILEGSSCASCSPFK
ncbi:uncharacterized protein LOC131025137 [Salvia miltiorrhiza]|uniref:uncharacterized protein LOC131025137 n=1 Tax=Salvia miltiorrhiza TaxID=226208 RepID=UPI0025AC047F|nr:uncharacterized protein LOC131025137 [Salvia miltiorrhiza]